MSKGKCTATQIGWWLLIIGGLNWGLVGVGGYFGGNWNVVNLLLGSWAWLEWLVYLLVGVSAIVALFGCKCNHCKTSAPATPSAPAEDV